MNGLILAFWSLSAFCFAPKPAQSPAPSGYPEGEQGCRIVRVEDPGVQRLEVAYETNGISRVTVQTWDYTTDTYKSVQLGKYLYLPDGRLDRVDLYDLRAGKELFDYTLCRMDYGQNIEHLFRKEEDEVPAFSLKIHFGTEGQIKQFEESSWVEPVMLPVHSRPDGRIDSVRVPGDQSLRFDYDRERNPFFHTHLNRFFEDDGSYAVFINYTPKNITGIFSGSGVDNAFAISYGYDEAGRVTRISMGENHYLLTYEPNCRQ